ncbi:L,D-transpeptidase [Bosea sp. BK604]|uniref:L,D-transpeptidase n=1 Tax=Bosea sp. BK604 TaxID=2512180 RepID=UPI00104B9D11|nr:L,D-transpeptidase [Bosea sp. BK604]TCR65024.1 lipoprotein-anchoring transpeptidase ErfK/SrfK [Bosea sp. BK604]
MSPALPTFRRLLTRLAILLIPLALAACVSARPQPYEVSAARFHPNAAAMAMYAEMPEEAHPLPATDISEVNPRFLRQEVSYPTREQPGTIVVDTNNRYLYLVREGGQAIRYGIGVGKQGMSWRGRATVGRKGSWPRWTPTADMIKRDPEKNGPWAGGMAGGLDNPLGARALYLYQGNRDTMYRIHGTTEPWSIGKAVSSGCIRMFNQDIIDLHSRVPVGTPVLVLNRDPLLKLSPEEATDEFGEDPEMY